MGGIGAGFATGTSAAAFRDFRNRTIKAKMTPPMINFFI
jgi:hypothetical protein